MYLNDELKYNQIKKEIGPNPNIKNLTFKKKFSNQGKQGIAGIISYNNQPITYKLSQYINHITKHEASIMNSLTKMKNYCPHFCKYIGLCSQMLMVMYRKLDNPFRVTSKHPITVDTLLMEYIEGKKLYTLIKNNSISDDIIFSTIKQLLFAISIAR